MRSLVVALVPMFALSFGVVACGEEDGEPAPSTQQQQLAGDGEACARTADCASGLTCQPAVNGGGLRTRGLPAPGGGEADGEPEGEPTDPDPTPTPAPAPKPDVRGRPDTDPTPAPQPSPAPAPIGFCH
ncbi:MAG: hypothetical protein KIT84_28100 [Labilithrix sp.]|nr:hypothetical protein [Labilithrix sp.]MCW5814921.1 hypothetical protein [Labilithrix sp.]